MTLLIRTGFCLRLLSCWLLFCCGLAPADFGSFVQGFVKGFRQLPVPEFTYDYREYFASIPGEAALAEQQLFFLEQQQQLKTFRKAKLSPQEQLIFDHLAYEISNNLQRLELEMDWASQGRRIPATGLHELKNHTSWYRLFLQRYTSLSPSPEAVEALGRREVARVMAMIGRLQQQSGHTDSPSFYRYLRDSSFFITDKEALLATFHQIDSTVRSRLHAFAGVDSVAPVYAMEWPGAGPYTPPGMYLNGADNALGRDVFQFNFHGGRFNRRAADWIYLHEAIPGHHLQSSFRRQYDLQPLFLYPGNFEGWACYVEYYGKELGLYKDLYSELGKWEWDLVRSARLVLDAGIHYHGWSREQAIQYWKQTIPGQDDIADREVTRVTNWPGQTVSYKAGADCIRQMREQWLQARPGAAAKDFHRWYLYLGNRPLEVIKNHLTI